VKDAVGKFLAKNAAASATARPRACAGHSSGHSWNSFREGFGRPQEVGTEL
jgi:hypothetical protein